ncbi:MAG: DUF11 domain-containing protein [Phycisphaerales bacterium]|nr:DUF11 domain-containing protein [Phycisphaerales bacterium]
MKKILVPALLAAAALFATAPDARAQLVIGNDSSTGQLWVIDIVNGGTNTRQLVSGTTAQVRGIAADNTNGVLYWLDGTVAPQSLYKATMTTSGTLTPVLVGVVRSGVTNVPLLSLAFDTVAGKLYGYWDSAAVGTEGIYEINVADATITSAYLPGVTGGQATGLDYDAATDAFYYTNDLTTVTTFSPNGRGLYKLSKPLTAPTVSFVTAYPGTDTDVDGLATGNGRAYLINDNAAHYVYNLTTNVYEPNIPQTFTSTGSESGGAWAPGLVPAQANGGNVAVTISDSPDPLTIPPGGDITYVITATNLGPDPATGVTVTGTLPGNVTFSSVTAPGTHNAGVISANFGTLASGASGSITVVVAGPVSAPATVTFTVDATTTSLDPFLTNNTATATTAVTEPPANLSIVVVDAPTTLVVPPGGEITFTATVNNTVAGNNDANNVVVTATVPPDYDFVSVTAPATYNAGTRVITANLGTVTFGSSPQIVAVVSRTTPVVGSVTVTFPWSVTSSAADPVLTNNTDNETTIIRQPQAALTISNVDSPDPIAVPPGGNINYLITVTNGQSATTDPNGAANVTVTGVLPPEVSFVSIDAPGTYDVPTRTISTNLGTVFNGAPAAFNVVVSADTIGSAVFPVTVSTTTFEPTVTNNTATATTTIRPPQANLGVAIIDPLDCAIDAGENFSYTVNVTNAGTETGEGAVLQFTLPSDVDATFVSSSPALVPVAGVITYNIGTVNVGTPVSLTVNMTAITAGATLSSSASVTGTLVDPTPANDTANQTTLLSSGGGPTTAAIKGVISTIAGSTSSNVPGLPGVKFSGTIMNPPWGSPDGTNFIQVVDTDQPTASDLVVLVSRNGVMTVEAREGNPITGITPAIATNLVTVIDTKAAINNAGNFAFSGTFTGSASNDYVVKNVAGVYSLVIDEDTTPSDTIVSGSATWNDVAGNVTIAPNNQVTFSAAVNGAPATTSDNATVRDDGATALAVEGVTTPGNLAGTPSTWQNFSSLDSLGLTFDATHTNWTLSGDTDNATTTNDNIAVRNGDVIMQEGETFTGATGTITTIGRVRTGSNGDWLGSFTGTGSIVYVVRNGNILIKTGDAVPGGNGETFNRSCFEVASNANGDYVYGVETTEADVLRDGVLVLNNTSVIARQNDPIDLNNDGVFNDDAFIRTFETDNIFMSNTDVFVTVTLRGPGAALCATSDTTAIGAALIRIPFTSSPAFPPRCNGADIAYDNGDFLPRAEIVDGTNGTPAIPGPATGTNNGVTEADYNIFFANYFDAFPVCDIANDDNTSRVPTPAPGTVVNNGVTEGDYNYFFSVFFDGCVL